MPPVDSEYSVMFCCGFDHVLMVDFNRGEFEMREYLAHDVNRVFHQILVLQIANPRIRSEFSVRNSSAGGDPDFGADWHQTSSASANSLGIVGASGMPSMSAAAINSPVGRITSPFCCRTAPSGIGRRVVRISA